MHDPVTKNIIVDADIGEVYSIWADFERFPQFMQHIESVRRTGDGLSHWVMEGPLGVKIEWDAETTRDEPNARIAWNSRDGGDIKTSGQVTFKALPNDTTEVSVTLQYVPPAGKIGEAAAKLLADPERMLEEDLRRFKAYAEGTARRRSYGERL